MIKIRPKRTALIQIRLTPHEKQTIEKHAQAMSVSVSDYIRLRLCAEQPDLIQQATNDYYKMLKQYHA